MKKNYSGNSRPFELVLCSSADYEKALPVLEKIDESGKQLCIADEKSYIGSKLKRACGVVAILGEGFSKSEKLQSAMVEASELGKDLIPVSIDSSVQSDIIQRIGFAKNIVDVSKYNSASDAAERIITADSLREPHVTDEQKKAAKLTSRLLLIGAAVILAAAIIFTVTKIVANNTGSDYIDKNIEMPSGLTEEDLSTIRYITLAGNSVFYGEEYEDTVGQYNNEEAEAETTYYLLSDGSELERGHYDNLDFLTIMPNLEVIHLVYLDVTELPDLSGLQELYAVKIDSCPVDNIEGLSECKNIVHVELQGTRVDDEELQVLNNLSKLRKLYIGNYYGTITTLENMNLPSLTKLQLSKTNLKSLKGLENSTRLSDLTIYNGYTLTDFSALGKCTELSSIYMSDVSAHDFSFLQNLSKLKELRLEYCQNVTDISAISGCTLLRNIEFQNITGVSDFSALSELKNLSIIRIYNSAGNNMDFVKPLEGKYGVNVGFSLNNSEGADYSGLSLPESYSFLHMNPNHNTISPALKQLEGKSVNYLQLHTCYNIDFSEVPKVNVLELCYGNAENLEGIEQVNPDSLVLMNIGTLRSLDGVQNTTIRELTIKGCPRLTDYEALYAKRWGCIDLDGVYNMPDFSRIQFGDGMGLKINNCTDIEDISFLNDIPDEVANSTMFADICIAGNDKVNDLGPLKRFKGETLTVSPQLEKQAQDLVNAGNFKQYRIEYPDTSWKNNSDRMYLLSLDELDTLTDSALAEIREIHMAGDMPYNYESYDIDWQHELKLKNKATGEEYTATDSTIDSVNLFSKLVNLETAEFNKPGRMSFDGIQGFEKLAYLGINGYKCGGDLKPVFAASSLKSLSIVDTDISDISGIENLYNLEELRIPWNPELEDITPVLNLPNLKKLVISNNMENALGSIEGANYGFELEIEGN